MPSEAAKKRKEKKKNQGKAKPAAKTNGTEQTNGNAPNGNAPNGSLENKFAKIKLSNLSVSGVLASHPESRDLHLSTISLRYHGAELLTDASCELNSGRRYGLLGPNGCGMSSFNHFLLSNFCAS